MLYLVILTVVFFNFSNNGSIKLINKKTNNGFTRFVMRIDVVLLVNQQKRINFPNVTLVDLFFNCTKEKELKIDCDDYDLDLRKLYEELKKEGPMSLIEIKGENATLKIWFE